jgi:hypothetical protein
VLAAAGLRQPKAGAGALRVAYHAACSLQHGQQIKTAPKALLRRAGFEVVEPADSASVLRLGGHLQPDAAEISRSSRRARSATLEADAPEVIAAGNIGCMMQIGLGTGVPVVHTVELLDWATGGPGRAGPAGSRIPAPRSWRSSRPPRRTGPGAALSMAVALDGPFAGLLDQMDRGARPGAMSGTMSGLLAHALTRVAAARGCAHGHRKTRLIQAV